MTLQDQLLAVLVQYGAPALCGVIILASIGVPLPATFLLIAAGSFVAQGDLSFWQVVTFGLGAAVLGDQIGYGVGRWGGPRVLDRVGRWVGGAERLEQARATTLRWGGAGVFLSRWLLTPVGPAINLTSGMTAYPWLSFVGLDVLGEIVWVVGYVKAGQLFSDRVQALSDLLGNLSWAALGLVAIVALSWLLLRQLRAGRADDEPAAVGALGQHADKR
jgi:membrane protein DedA with SNARE-associated domain